MKQIRMVLTAMVAVMAIGAVGATAASAKNAHLTVEFGGDACALQADRSDWTAGPPGDWFSELTNIGLDPTGPCGVDNISIDEPITVAKNSNGDIWIEDQPLEVSFRIIAGLFQCTYEGTAADTTYVIANGPGEHAAEEGKGWGVVVRGEEPNQTQTDYGTDPMAGTAYYQSGISLCPGSPGNVPLSFNISGWIKS